MSDNHLVWQLDSFTSVAVDLRPQCTMKIAHRVVNFHIGRLTLGEIRLQKSPFICTTLRYLDQSVFAYGTTPSDRRQICDRATAYPGCFQSGETLGLDGSFRPKNYFIIVVQGIESLRAVIKRQTFRNRSTRGARISPTSL